MLELTPGGDVALQGQGWVALKASWDPAPGEGG